MQSPSDSADPGGRLARLMDALRQWTETVRRAFVEFLTIPSLMIVGFLVLAAIMYALDEARIAAKGANSDPIWGGLFSDAQAMRDFLGVIASSIITVTSITLSLLLIAVQQGAASLTSLVFRSISSAPHHQAGAPASFPSVCRGPEFTGPPRGGSRPSNRKSIDRS